MWAAACWPFCRASSHVLCDRQLIGLLMSLRQNRSQLMRMPQVHCAESYLRSAPIRSICSVRRLVLPFRPPQLIAPSDV